jgi:hypothetical protein
VGIKAKKQHNVKNKLALLRGTSQAHIVQHLVRIFQYYVLSGHNKFKIAA